MSFNAIQNKLNNRRIIVAIAKDKSVLIKTKRLIPESEADEYRKDGFTVKKTIASKSMFLSKEAFSVVCGSIRKITHQKD